MTAVDGLVHFECAGITATFDPAAAVSAGQRLIARVKSARFGKLAGAGQRDLYAGQQLVALAAEASRQRTVATPLPAAA